jgi:hypothetical protein
VDTEGTISFGAGTRTKGLDASKITELGVLEEKTSFSLEHTSET